MSSSVTHTVSYHPLHLQALEGEHLGHRNFLSRPVLRTVCRVQSLLLGGVFFCRYWLLVRDRIELGLFFERDLGRESTMMMLECLGFERRSRNRRFRRQVNCSDILENSRRLWRLGEGGQNPNNSGVVVTTCYGAVTSRPLSRIIYDKLLISI